MTRARTTYLGSLRNIRSRSARDEEDAKEAPCGRDFVPEGATFHDKGLDKSLGQTHHSDWLWLGRLDAESESDWNPSQAGPSVQAQVSPALPLIRLRWETLPAGSDEIPD